MNSGNGGRRGTKSLPLAPSSLFLISIAPFDSKAANRSDKTITLRFLKKRDKRRACVWRAKLGFHSRHPWMPSQGFPPETDCNYVQLAHAQEAIHKFSVKPL